MKHFSLPKSKRLLTNSRFKAVLARNLRSSDTLLTVFKAENNLPHPRLGVSVAKAFRSAVLRNRLKRLIREAFRQNQHSIPQCFDYLVMLSPSFVKSAKNADPKKTVKKLTYKKIEYSLLSLINRIGQRNH